jgi:hypothetical protein
MSEHSWLIGKEFIIKSMFHGPYGVYGGRVYIHPGSKIDD